MRVCMLLRNTFTRDARVLREARSLASAGHDVVVIAIRAGELPAEEERDGFLIRRIVEGGRLAGPTINAGAGGGARSRRRPAALVHLRDVVLGRRMARAARETPADVYHAHDLNTLEPAVLAAGSHAAKLVYDAHELYPDLTGLAPRERARWRRLEERLIGRADAVIAASPSRAEEMARRYGVARPHVVMNWPPARPPMDPQRSPLTAMRRDGETLLVYAGGFTPNRGLENVVLAAERMPDCRLVMLGWGPIEPALRALASDRVVFAGSVEPDLVVETIAGADIGLAPYLPIGRNNELAAPNKLFEYFQAGLAIAASDLPDIRKIVADEGAGVLFDASDPGSIVSAVAEARSSIDTLKRNAVRAAGTYTWERQERVLLEVYDSLSATA